jgi:hypothetical protein
MAAGKWRRVISSERLVFWTRERGAIPFFCHMYRSDKGRLLSSVMMIDVNEIIRQMVVLLHDATNGVLSLSGTDLDATLQRPRRIVCNCGKC